MQNQMDALTVKQHRSSYVRLQNISVNITTSLYWDMQPHSNIIKWDYDIKRSGINFLSLSKITYDTKNIIPVGFY